MNSGKVAGVDKVPAEQLRNMGEEATMLFNIEMCKNIYLTIEWPEEFLQTIKIVLRKKASAEKNVVTSEPLF